MRGSADDEEEAEVEGDEKLSEEGVDRSEEERASLPRSELRCERSRPLSSDLEEDEVDVWKAELSRRVGVVWREDDAKVEAEDARLGVLPRTDEIEVTSADAEEKASKNEVSVVEDREQEQVQNCRDAGSDMAAAGRAAVAAKQGAWLASLSLVKRRERINVAGGVFERVFDGWLCTD